MVKVGTPKSSVCSSLFSRKGDLQVSRVFLTFFPTCEIVHNIDSYTLEYVWFVSSCILSYTSGAVACLVSSTQSNLCESGENLCFPCFAELICDLKILRLQPIVS